jgi:hypothetical protein
MTETASSLDDRTESGRFVFNNLSCVSVSRNFSKDSETRIS